MGQRDEYLVLPGIKFSDEWFWSPSSRQAYDNSYFRWVLGCSVDTPLKRASIVLGLRFIERLIEGNMKPCRLLTEAEVVQRLNHSASAGRKYKAQTKAHLLMSDVTVLGREVLRLEQAEAVEVPDNDVCSKSEVLPIRKKTVKERTFVVVDTAQQAYSLKYTGDFYDNLIEVHEQMPFCVGMSNFYGQFFRRMRRHGKFNYHYSLDACSLEKSFDAFVHEAIGNVCARQAWPDRPEFQRHVRRSHEMLSRWWAVHNDGFAYLVEGREPSGSNSTIFDNCMHVGAVIFSYLHDNGYTNPDFCFNEEKFMITILGDDVLLSLPDQLDIVDFQERGHAAGIAFKCECQSSQLEDHKFISRRISADVMPHASPQKLVERLRHVGTDPSKVYEVLCGLRNELYHNTEEFRKIDQACQYVEQTYGVTNRRVDRRTLRGMYATGI